MLCPNCQTQARPFARNRNGSRRYRCDACRRTFTDQVTRPRDRRRIDAETEILCLRMILEGNSVRSTERLTGVHRDTILDAMVVAGRLCERFLEQTVQGVPVNDVECDEVWGFCGCKERTRRLRGHGEDKGDAWCYVAIERTSKVILAWHLGKRTMLDTAYFAEKLRHATSGRFQVTTDGYIPYRGVMPAVFGNAIDFAQLVKVFEKPQGESAEARYSPPQVVEVIPMIQSGRPDEDRICTSHVERANLSIRMGLRRMTRLTNAHSKKWANHEAAFGLYFAFYNYCRVHSTLKTTPAVAAGLTDHVWSVAELLDRAARS